MLIIIIIKLPEKIVNVDVLRYFSRVQIDPEASIRTNTTICLGKIAKYINDSVNINIIH